jgi:hypothetical protein
LPETLIEKGMAVSDFGAKVRPKTKLCRTFVALFFGANEKKTNSPLPPLVGALCIGAREYVGL